MKGCLALEDGTVFEGEVFGAPGERAGEAVFNTSMTGYQEVLTDPSYKGQIVAMTYPLIGNYGINDEDSESSGPQVEGFVVRELSRIASNWRSRETLADYVTRHRLVCLEGVDTRALTRRIRTAGAMRAVITSIAQPHDELLAKVRASPPMQGRNLVDAVTTPSAYRFGDGAGTLVAVYDFGVKHNILRELARRGFAVLVVPAGMPADELLAERPVGVVLSNGPGDPAAVTGAIAAVRSLLGRVPLFGICLGHQILAHALGARTFKLKFGHRGGNQPVKNLRTGRVEITTQNHGFAVDTGSLPESVELTHVNLNDDTCEGFACRALPAFSVQYHPEACPGPHDTAYLFDRFAELVG